MKDPVLLTPGRLGASLGTEPLVPADAARVGEHAGDGHGRRLRGSGLLGLDLGGVVGYLCVALVGLHAVSLPRSVPKKRLTGGDPPHG
jgi:hypothetical protein